MDSAEGLIHITEPSSPCRYTMAVLVLRHLRRNLWRAIGVIVLERRQCIYVFPFTPFPPYFCYYFYLFAPPPHKCCTHCPLPVPNMEWDVYEQSVVPTFGTPNTARVRPQRRGAT